MACANALSGRLNMVILLLWVVALAVCGRDDGQQLYFGRTGMGTKLSALAYFVMCEQAFAYTRRC
jgi:hypothetical protein